MSRARMALALLGLGGLLGCLWLVDDRGYQRGWTARDDEVRQQAQVTAQVDLSTLTRNTANTAEADRRLLGQLQVGLANQQDIQTRLRAYFATQPEDPHAPEVPFAQCRLDPDTQRLLHEAHDAAAAALDPGGAQRVHAESHGAAPGQP